jgi:hypothetical protein
MNFMVSLDDIGLLGRGCGRLRIEIPHLLDAVRHLGQRALHARPRGALLAPLQQRVLLVAQEVGIDPLRYCGIVLHLDLELGLQLLGPLVKLAPLAAHDAIYCLLWQGSTAGGRAGAEFQMINY